MSKTNHDHEQGSGATAHSFDTFLAEQLQDPEIKAEYDALSPEFSPEEVVWEIEVDAELYEQAKAVFAEYGLTIEEATVQFIKATIACGDLPFPYTEDDIKVAEALSGNKNWAK